MKKALFVAGLLLAAGVLMVPAVSVYYEYSGGAACARCHEIRPNHNTWLASSHRGIACTKCHGDALTTDVAFHMGNLRRVRKHLSGDVPEQIRLRPADVKAMVERCRSCHRQEYAQWYAGPHSAMLARFVLDKEHNTKKVLMDDCLRCHGAHFDGGIRDLVAPLDRKGPWQLLRKDMAEVPAIPCLACHQMHREGRPEYKQANAASQETVRPSLALYDRRESVYYPVANLPIPAMLDGARPVKMSPDARQGLCFQCHAAVATRQVGSGDDRTPMGVHEGISCVACHQKHGQHTRASCATCHPRLSNCGLDVEKMDTTFKDAKSKHNVHWVKCGDCHPKGVPKKRERVG